MRRVATTLFVLAVLIPAVAQAARPSKLKLPEETGELRVVDLEDQKIEGMVHKPSVFYVLTRARLAYTGLEMKQDFTPRIERMALKRPF